MLAAARGAAALGAGRDRRARGRRRPRLHVPRPARGDSCAGGRDLALGVARRRDRARRRAPARGPISRCTRRYGHRRREGAPRVRRRLRPAERGRDRGARRRRRRTPSPSAPSWSASGASPSRRRAVRRLSQRTSRGSSWTTPSARPTPPRPARTSARTTRPPPARGRPRSRLAPGQRRRAPRPRARRAPAPAHARQRRRHLRALAAVGRAPARLHDQHRPRRPVAAAGPAPVPWRARRRHRHRLPDRAGHLRAVVAPVPAGALPPVRDGQPHAARRPARRRAPRRGLGSGAAAHRPLLARPHARGGVRRLRLRLLAAGGGPPAGGHRAHLPRDRGDDARPPGRARCRARCPPTATCAFTTSAAIATSRPTTRASPRERRGSTSIRCAASGAGGATTRPARDLDRVGARIELAPAARRWCVAASYAPGPAELPADRRTGSCARGPTWPPRTRRWPPADAGAPTRSTPSSSSRASSACATARCPTISIDLRDVWDATLSDTVHSAGRGLRGRPRPRPHHASPGRGVPARGRPRRLRQPARRHPRPRRGHRRLRRRPLADPVRRGRAPGARRMVGSPPWSPGTARRCPTSSTKGRPITCRAPSCSPRGASTTAPCRAGPGHAPLVRHGASVDTVGPCRSVGSYPP